VRFDHHRFSNSPILQHLRSYAKVGLRSGPFRWFDFEFLIALNSQILRHCAQIPRVPQLPVRTRNGWNTPYSGILGPGLSSVKRAQGMGRSPVAAHHRNDQVTYFPRRSDEGCNITFGHVRFSGLETPHMSVTHANFLPNRANVFPTSFKSCHCCNAHLIAQLHNQ
jgi:hypothetical protein